MDSLSAVKQPLSEIQPKTTEEFQEGKVGSLHPSLYGDSWHHLMSPGTADTVSSSNCFERNLTSAIFRRCSVHTIQAASQMSLISGNHTICRCSPHPAHHYQTTENGLHFSVVRTKALAVLGSFSIQKNYQRRRGSVHE